MNPATIKVVNKSNYSQWCNKISNIQYDNWTGEKRLIIDLSQADFLSPVKIVLLAALIEDYYLNQSAIEIYKPKNKQVLNFLDNIHFFKYWEPSFNQNKYTPTSISTNLCLWKVDHSMIDQYSLKASEYFQANYFQDKDLDGINISLTEIFNNIFDHSQSKVSGYTISQYFPKSHKIKIAVCDFGKGIASVVNEYYKNNGKKTMPDNKAILKAFEKGFSSKSQQHNRGFGLDNLRAYTMACNGSLRVISNSGTYLVKQENGKEHHQDYSTKNCYFQGTLIEVVLDTLTFEVRELFMIDEDFVF